MFLVGHDILFFWVARMTMLSLLLLKTLPFKTVVLHAMVRDSHGKKMSKSLGNVIDPIDVIHGMTLDQLLESSKSQTLSEKEVVRAQQAQKQNFPKGIPECGADALRYGLLAYTHQGRSINLDVNRIVGYRYFCNKLWNATKLYLKWFNLYGLDFQYVDFNESFFTLRWHEQWILHRLSVCIERTNTALSSFNFSEAVTATYSFWLHDLCDIYLEMMKDYWTNAKAMQSASLNQIFSVFLTCFDQGLRLLHPMMPFVTEELYQRLPFPKNSSLKFESICIATYPTNANAWNQPILDVIFFCVLLKK
jgi:valyl-tRNA synthetase